MGGARGGRGARPWSNRAERVKGATCPPKPAPISLVPHACPQGEPVDLERLGSHVVASGAACCVMVDCSASDAVPDQYAGWLRGGCHVVTPNKKAGAGPLPRYQQLRQAQRDASTAWMYEVWGAARG